VTDAGRCDILDGATGQILRTHLGTYASQELHCRAILGDLDRDGKRDYLVASNAHFWGYSSATGAQLFSFPKLTQSYGEYLTDIGDFNADGFDDIVFRDRGSYPYVVYEQTLVFAGPSATQQLWNHTTWIQNPGPIHYYEHVGRLGDLDGDGHADLGLIGGAAAISSTVISGRTSSPLLEVGANSPYLHTLYNHLDGPGDVDGNGIVDLLIRHWPTATTQEVRLVSFAPPGVLPIGAGCASPMGSVPRIGIGTGARLGRTMTVNLANAEPTLLAAALGVGFSDQQWNGTPLPIDLGAYGLPGCFWRVAADVTLLVPTVGANGTRHHATHDVPVPQVPQLLGVALYWQWLVLEQGPAGVAGSVTGAMRTTIVQ